MWMLAKNVLFKDSEKVFYVWFSFLKIRLLAVLLFVFILIGLEIHLGFLNIVFEKVLSTTVGEISQGEFFIHVLDRTILQNSKILMTSLQFVIRPIILKLLKSTRSP